MSTDYSSHIKGHQTGLMWYSVYIKKLFNPTSLWINPVWYVLGKECNFSWWWKAMETALKLWKFIYHAGREWKQERLLSNQIHKPWCSIHVSMIDGNGDSSKDTISDHVIVVMFIYRLLKINGNLCWHFLLKQINFGLILFCSP